MDVRRLMSECDVLRRNRLGRCSRGNRLERDSPALRICMETTRASLLWQAAAVSPEPERMPSLRCVADSRRMCRTCLGLLVFCYIDKCCSKKGLEGRAISQKNLIGRGLSLGCSDIAFSKTRLGGTRWERVAL